jgi:hypothetical protein
MAWHSYEFYKKRQNDPKWRNAWIQAENNQIETEIKFVIQMLIIFQIIIIAALFWNYSYEHDISNFNQAMLIDFFNYCINAYQRAYEFIRNYINQFSG